MDKIDVSVLMLGLDADARAEVQQAMNEIAASGDTSQPEGLVQMLREVVSLLRGLEPQWTHLGAISAAPVAAEEAEARFVQAATDARSRFDTEVVRNAHGEITRRKAPKRRPSNRPSVVVVSLIVAAGRELADVSDPRDLTSFGLALDSVASLTADELVALEVVWAPADENDRPPLEEIERKHPELVRLGASGVA